LGSAGRSKSSLSEQAEQLEFPPLSTPISILMVHNEYILAGGEDSVLQAESKLLQDHGEKVHFHIVSSKSIESKAQLLSIAWNFSYSNESKREIKALLAKLRPDVVHVHNFVPLITPSVFDACKESGVPVVQTLHNFRHICSSSVLLRDGKICEKCIGGTHYNAARYSCYRSSFLQSLIHGHMLEKHRRIGTWATKVDRFIAVARFARDKYVEAGFPPERIVAKYNFLPAELWGDPGNLDARWHAPRALYVGRLAPEKGVRTLVEAWREIDIPLDMIGGGQLEQELRQSAPANVTIHGARPRPEIFAAMRKATFQVMTSEWYETCPMVIVEGMAHGLPIIASRLGGMQEIVSDKETGLLFEAGNPRDLAAKVRWALGHSDDMKAMSPRAIKVSQERFGAEQNYRELRKIYDTVIEENRRTRQA
jgi:glycosyltransferase involved in cell wall biosynthesis